MLHTCTILILNPVSLARVSLTFLHGLGLTSKEALKALLCCVVSIVRGRFGPLLPSIDLVDGTISSQKYSPTLLKSKKKTDSLIF